MYFLTNENAYGRSLSLRRHTYCNTDISTIQVFELSLNFYNLVLLYFSHLRRFLDITGQLHLHM